MVSHLCRYFIQSTLQFTRFMTYNGINRSTLFNIRAYKRRKGYPSPYRITCTQLLYFRSIAVLVSENEVINTAFLVLKRELSSLKFIVWCRCIMKFGFPRCFQWTLQFKFVNQVWRQSRISSFGSWFFMSNTVDPCRIQRHIDVIGQFITSFCGLGLSACVLAGGKIPWSCWMACKSS